jgi:predicted CXXCH cytochrome family protein
MSKTSALIALTVAAMLLWVVPAVAATPSDAKYVGSDTCKMCHKGMTPKIVEAYDKSAHSKAMIDATKTPAAIVGSTGEACPVKKDQIKYTLGVGIKEQAYLDADLKVLPAQWEVADKKYTTIPADDGAKQCVGCHTVGYVPATKTWTQLGVGCESCHGPGSAHAGSGDKTKITNPKSLPKDREAMVCGQCHSKGTDTTKAYAFPVGFRPGDDLTKAFIDAKPTTPGRNQQYSELLTSKHMTAGIVCVTCHDPHSVGTAVGSHQLKKALPDLCLDCHKDKDMKAHAPSAPAGATCATCHMPGGAHTFKAPHAG